jgi:hypothetical protein
VESELHLIPTKALTMGESMGVHATGQPKCEWCRRINREGLWLRMSQRGPGFHVSIAPKCAACARKARLVRDAEGGAGR